jgi:oligopeptide/dipeptide ABC transporter ATP-binding protein
MVLNGILEVEDLRVEFRTYRGIVKALNGVSFTVERGEVFGLAGETGSGKSVTGLAIQRLLPGNAAIVGGRIVFDGKDLLSLKEEDMNKIRGKEITAVFQDPHTYLNPVFTVHDQFRDILLMNDREIASLKDKREVKKAVDNKIIQMLAEVQMPAPERVVKMYPHELSGGMKQRMMLAMAFSLKPKLIIADEPTTALDVTIQAQVLELMKSLQRRYGTSVILITHDLGVIAETCRRIAVMYAGRIVEMGGVDSVYNEPLHPYTRGLMRALPRADKDMKVESIGGSVPDLVGLPPGCPFHPRCSRAMEVCRKLNPKTLNIDGRVVECHLYDEEIAKGRVA